MMNDLSQKDFDTLLNFLNSYELETILKNENLIKTVKRLHRVYFGFITCTAELEMLSNDDENLGSPTLSSIKFLKEVCSDLGHAFFCNMQGTYKGAGMLLRSSLENFWKSVISSRESTGITEFGYRLKERARKTYIKNQLINELINETYNNHYSHLSKMVHTANIQQMEQTSALNYFPKFADDPSKKLESQFVKLTQYYSLISCLIYNECFHEMHPQNQGIIIRGIAPNRRAIVLGDTVS